MTDEIKLKYYNNSETGCCARFPAKRWDKKTIKWKGKLFVKDHVTSIFHMPINFGRVLMRVSEKVSKADAFPKDYIWFNDENSLWGSDYTIWPSQRKCLVQRMSRFQAHS